MTKIELVKFKKKELELIKAYNSNIIPMKGDSIVDPNEEFSVYEVIGRTHNLLTDTLTIIVKVVG